MPAGSPRIKFTPDAARNAVRRVLEKCGCSNIAITATRISVAEMDIGIIATDCNRRTIKRGSRFTHRAELADVESWAEACTMERRA